MKSPPAHSLGAIWNLSKQMKDNNTRDPKQGVALRDFSFNLKGKKLIRIPTKGQK